jgi:transposase-like protein
MIDAIRTDAPEQGDIWQLLPDLTDDEYQALKADIAERGVMVPIEYDERGDILDGHHRVRACRELGIRDWPTVTRGGMDEDAKAEHVLSLNLDRRHLSREQRRELVRGLRERGWSLRRIARRLGIGVMTTRRDAESGVPDGTPDRSVGDDGKSYPAHRPEPAEPDPTLDQGYDEPEHAASRPISVFAPDQKGQKRAQEAAQGLGDDHAGKSYDVNAANRKARKKSQYDGDEWFTPTWIFDALDLTFTIDAAHQPTPPT